MSSHATEGAQPSTAPGGEAPTAAQAAPAPAAADPGKADPGEADVEGTEHGGTEHGGTEHGGTEHGGTEHGGTEHGGTEHGGTEHGGTDARPVSVLAIVALVTGLVALVPIAVASGVASLVGIRRTGSRGHGMAMAGLFLSAAWVIVGAAIGTVGVITHGFNKPVTVKYQESAVFKLREGDCVDGPNGTLVSILPCSTPHEAEVFATFALPGSRWPGTAAIASEASSGCVSRLTAYLNPQLAISLSQSFVYPNQVAWTGGTRTVVCEVRASSGQLTGSVRSATSAGV